MKKTFILISAIALIALSTVSHAFNSNDTIVKSDTTVVDTVKKDTASAEKTKKEKKKNEFQELIKKDSTYREGLFTVRHIEDKYYFEVPDSLLGRYILAVTRFTSVPQGLGKYAGEMVNESTLYFEKRDHKTMLLRAYVLTEVADEKDDIFKTLNASTTNPIVASFKIVQDNPSKEKSMIDVTSLFQSENELVGMGSATKEMKLGGLQNDRTFIDTMKVFPINIEVASTRTYNANASGKDGNRTHAALTGAVTLGLNTSLLLLPKEPMRKRLWDQRVGYFVKNFTIFSDDQLRTERESMIARYNLVPKDKEAYKRGKLVEPVKPIVYYIDPATPKKWVPYLIKGINDWNAAFEEAGFKNAIQGKEWPADRPDMSVDDARYCVIRYLPSEIENAYGPHVADPRSGEIVESHICWYHNVMSLLTKWYMIQCGPLDKKAQTMNMDEKLMGELIRFVSSHEVGHSLGLRHNMGASFNTPVEKLRDKKWVEKHGHTLSIMDYARFNYVAQPEDGISEKGLFPRINDYDKWAIKWGYQYRPEFKDEYEEKNALMAETTKVLEKRPELWFGGEGRGEDPRAQTEDLGDNSMLASDYGIKNLKRVVNNLPEWTKQSDYRYADLRSMYDEVRGQFRRYINHVMKNLTGRYQNNLPGRPAAEIPSAEIRAQVVDWLDRNVFEAPMWLYPETITSKIDFNAIADMESRQNNIIDRCLDIYALSRLNDDSFVKAHSYSVETYLDDLMNAVWKPVKGNTVSDKLRRSLQRSYVTRLNNIINPDKPDNTEASLYLLPHIDKIEAFCRLHSNGSDINALHYKSLLNEIKLIRERKTTLHK